VDSISVPRQIVKWNVSPVGPEVTVHPGSGSVSGNPTVTYPGSAD